MKKERAVACGIGEVSVLEPYAQNGQQKEVDYLLSLSADRLLYWFYRNAGLTPKAESGYGGWESTLIGGHTMGHYLSALSQGCANAGISAQDREALYARVNYVVAALSECQAHSRGKAGFLWGAYLPPEEQNVEFQFDNVEQGKTDYKTESWVPWYTMHKILAGLLDAYTHAHSEAGLRAAKRLGDWVYDRVRALSADTREVLLKTEYGGMNDALFALYAISGDERHLYAAKFFNEESLFDRVLQGEQNCLCSLHANTTIPKIIGALCSYLYGGQDERYLRVAERFFDCVMRRHTYHTGGNSDDEHFFCDGDLDAHRSEVNCETCNVYNMQKLARLLFLATENVKYLHYYAWAERNAILSSQNPQTGMTTYFQPMASGYFKVFSTPEDSFWCCTGSGMENFTKLGAGIYYRKADGVVVAAYTASHLDADGVALTQTANLEESDAVAIEIGRAPAAGAALYFRVPDWSPVFTMRLNGKPVDERPQSGFVRVFVKSGDRVEITLKREFAAHALQGGENVYAFTFGPFLLSVPLGKKDMCTKEHGIAVRVPKSKDMGGVPESLHMLGKSVAAFTADIDAHFKKTNGGFVLSGVDVPLRFIYHYRNYDERYAIYFRLTEA
ncbi:MAG: glycoside hydrolase family 127 protein [Clostridiales bacterium]|nr:glycoside hydrolase family 127 protein [Clostridiales bacterium]